MTNKPQPQDQNSTLYWDNKTKWVTISVPFQLKQRIEAQAQLYAMSSSQMINASLSLVELNDIDFLISIVRRRYQSASLSRNDYVKLSVLYSLLQEIAIATQAFD